MASRIFVAVVLVLGVITVTNDLPPDPAEPLIGPVEEMFGNGACRRCI